MLLTLAVTIAPSGSSDSQDHYLPVPGAGTDYLVERVTFIPRVAVTANGTNYWTVALNATDGEAGSPAASFGGWTTDSDVVGYVAHAVNDKIVVTPTTGLDMVTAGGSILINIDEGGTAASAFDGVFLAELRKIPSPA